jgi:HTH-type transcriptional regulator/antitoxin HigA
MVNLTYTIIKTDTQYNRYCSKLEELISSNKRTKACQDEIELLTLLIKTYDEAHSGLTDADPVELLKALMKSHQLKAVDLAKLLHVSEGLVSDMLHYKKGLSKETIRILSDRFKLNQIAFNRPYTLVVPARSKSKNNSRKAA